MSFGGKRLEPWNFCLGAGGAAAHREGLLASKRGKGIFLSGWCLVWVKTD